MKRSQWNKDYWPKKSLGHQWKVGEDGDIDIFGTAQGTHNGPVCVRCDYSYCHHCHALPKQKCTKRTAAASSESSKESK